MFKIGRFGESTEWLTFDNTKIRLNKEKPKVKEQPWNYDEHVKQDCFNVRDELLLSADVDISELQVFKQAGIKENIHPGVYWHSKIKKLIASRMPNKSKLDVNMYLGIHNLPQETFVFKEERPNRSILVFDLVSAYPSSLLENVFPNPAVLRFIDNNEVHSAWDDNITQGLFRVRLKLKNDTPSWFKALHPLYINKDSLITPFNWQHGEIETFIHKTEKNELSHFVDITPLDGMASISLIHPLKSIIEDLLNTKDNSSALTEKAQCKWLLNRIVSAHTNLPFKKLDNDSTNKHFESLGMAPRIRNNSYPTNSGWMIKNIYSANAIYTWQSTVTGIIRRKWLEMLRHIISSSTDALVCYTNIDSFHVSIPNSKKEDFLAYLKNQGLLGDTSGKWKLDSIGNSGFWFANNVYWIHQEKNMIKHANKKHLTKTKVVCYYVQKNKILKYKSQLWRAIDNRKRLILVDKDLRVFKRINLTDICENHLLHMCKEAVKTRNLKKKIWYEHRSKYVKNRA